jgi:hypothetical protein
MDSSRKAFCLYGLEAGDLNSIRQELEKALNIAFEAHNSSYLGDYYLFQGKDGEQIRLRPNMDPLDGSPAEPAFKEKALLLEVDSLTEGSPRSAEIENMIRKCLPRVELLRRETH